MARKKHAEEHVNLERWLVSYADFITLLFATFVVLYALSQIDLAKFKDLKISLAKAFSSAPTILQGDEGVLNKKGNDVMDAGGQMDNQNIIPPLLDAPYAKKEESTFQDAIKNLDGKKINSIKGVKAEITERGLIIKLVGNIFFESSTATIKKESYKTLEEVGNMIKTKFPNHLIRVEGHTDNQLMSSSFYPSNWELSSARASSIVRFMISNYGISKDRFSALGYADSRPITSNNTEEGRKKNRRVEIVILRNTLLKTETLSQEFKRDLKKEVTNFTNIEKPEKKDDPAKTSDAVQNLLKDSGAKNNVIIFNNPNDAYKKDAEKILKQLKEQEQQAEEDSKTRKKAFFNSLKKQF